VNFRPALRDDHGGLLIFEKFKKVFGQFLLLIRQGARNDCIVIIQPVKRCAEFALLRFIDGELVLFQPLPFSFCPGRTRVLTADVCQFSASESRIHFNRPQGVRRLDRSVLVCVAREDDAAIALFDEREQLQHLLSADLTGFIHLC
jgi:hypothetical protein